LRFVRGKLVLTLVTLLVVLRLYSMAVDETYNAPGPLQNARTVVIPPDGTAAAAAVLRQDGVINHALVFRAAAWFTRGQGPIHAGEYFIPAHSSLQQILWILRFWAPVAHQVTIPEGLTAIQIAKILNTAGFAAGSVPPPPEGAVLPQTYNYTLNTPRAAIVGRAEAAMRRALARAWAGRDPSIPLAWPEQAVILASIVQEESPVMAELPEIAAVYENRLARGMKLQADPTVIYAASAGATASGPAITRADLANPSPYNTYAWEGLPPGPICSPGIAALQAVLHPASTSALFFVATGTGGHVFASTYREQLANIAAYKAALRRGSD
jgi:UPF0755 protein